MYEIVLAKYVRAIDPIDEKKYGSKSNLKLIKNKNINKKNPTAKPKIFLFLLLTRLP
jgi:hypothetical protein